MSKYVRVSALPDGNKTPNYLDENGDVTVHHHYHHSFHLVGSGSDHGGFLMVVYFQQK